jgi:hypothetical protein
MYDRRITYDGGEVPVIAIVSAAGTACVSAMIERGGEHKHAAMPNSHLIYLFSLTNIRKQN